MKDEASFLIYYRRCSGREKNVQTKQTYLLSIYISSLYVSMFLHAYSFSILWYSLIVFSPLIFLIYNSKLTFKKNIYILIFYLFFSSYFIITSSLTQNNEVKIAILSFTSTISSLLNGYLLSQRKLKLKIIATPIILFILFSFFLIFKGTNPNLVFPKTSRNTFSWIAIFGSSLFYICQLKKETDGKISIWPASCGFIISVWSLGRSGIISSGVLLIGVIIYKLKNHKARAVPLIFLIILFIVLFFSLSKPLLDFQNKVAMRFMEGSINDNPRVEIASNYIKNIASIQGILFGVKLSTINYMKQWNFNLHNSFLQFHSFMGIGSLILIMLIIIGIMRKGLQRILLGFIGIALLLRISTETGGFINPMSFLLFYFLFSDAPLSKR